MKKCSKCSIEKPFNRFSLRDKGTDKERPRNECKECLNKIRREGPNYGKWHKINKERVKKYMENYDLERKWGMTKAEFDTKLASQGGGCKICGIKTFTGSTKRARVDHCHKTGKIRGLLCGLCNVGLGAFKDNIEALEQAIKYLKENS